MLIARYHRESDRCQSLKTHLENVANKASEHLAHYGLSAVGELVGWLHDLYKSLFTWQSELKQQKALSVKKGAEQKRRPLGVPHAPPAARMMRSLFAHSLDSDTQQMLLQMVSLVIYAHHGYLMDALTPDGMDQYAAAICEADPGDSDGTERYFDEVIDRGRLLALWEEATQQLQRACDRIRIAASGFGDPVKREKALAFLLGQLVRSVYSALIDADRLDAARFEQHLLHYEPEKPAPDWKVLRERLEQHIAGLRPGSNEVIRRLRSEISDACASAACWSENLLALHAPTGGGKTFSGLRYALMRAEGKGRTKIIYVVSYTTILDQVYHDYRQAMGENGYELLLHHSNLLPDRAKREISRLLNLEEQPSALQDAAEEAEYRQEMAAERWDADIILTTQVQFLNAAFLGTSKAARRFHALHDAVIIFDEPQTVPPRLLTLFNLLVSYLTNFCNCDVLLCTATQPTFDQLPFPMPPIRNVFQAPASLFDRMRRVVISDIGEDGILDATSLATKALKLQERWKSLLVVLNTREAARKVYDALKESEPVGVSLFLISNDLCPAHRDTVLKQLRESVDTPAICVSTQVIECGVDLSLGCGMRSRAGADNISQSAGRVNRHQEDSQARPVYVFRSADEKLTSLPGIVKAQRAYLKLLSDCDGDADQIQDPDNMACYYQYYFAEQRHQLNYPLGAKDADIHRSTSVFELLSDNGLGCEALSQNTGKAPAGPLRQAFQTAGRHFAVIDNEGVGVLVPYGKGADLISLLLSNPMPGETAVILRQAQHYTINLYANRIRELSEAGALFMLPCGALALNKEWYDAEATGLRRSPVYDVDSHILTNDS